MTKLGSELQKGKQNMEELEARSKEETNKLLQENTEKERVWMTER